MLDLMYRLIDGMVDLLWLGRTWTWWEIVRFVVVMGLAVLLLAAVR